MLGLAITTLLAVAAAVAYGIAAWALVQRVGREASTPVGFLAAGFIGFALVAAADAAKFAVGFLQGNGQSVYLAMVWLKILALGLGLGGLGAYVLFLWVGRRWAYVVGMLPGIVTVVGLLAATNASAPGEVRVGTWATRMSFDGPIPPTSEALFVGLLFFLPYLLIGLGYLGFARYLHDPVQRTRHRLVAASVGLFMISAVFHGSSRINVDGPALPVAMALLLVGGIASAIGFRTHREQA